MAEDSYWFREVIFPVSVSEQTSEANLHPIRLIKLYLTVPSHAFGQKSQKTVRKRKHKTLRFPAVRKAETKGFQFLTEGSWWAFLGANEANPTVQKIGRQGS